jgi:uncharacterized protein (TIGR00369 family)
MDQSTGILARIRAINDQAAFNRWCGIEVVSAEPGGAVIAMPWRPEAGQYAGFLHAGLIGALIDTACGFAAVTLVGRVLASHYTVNCLRPAVGHRFIARARVVNRASRRCSPPAISMPRATAEKSWSPPARRCSWWSPTALAA